jgi:hypothetical protein
LVPGPLSASYACIIRDLGYGNSSRSIISSAILALVSFFYIYTASSFLRINIHILQNRLSYNTYFDFYVINRHTDHIIIATGVILWAALSLRGKTRIVITTSYGVATLIALMSNIAILLDIIAIMAIPIVICILIYNKLASVKIVNTNPNLSLNYIAIIVIVTGIIGIILSVGVIFYPPVNLVPSIPNYIYEIFVVFSSLSPLLMLLLVSCLPVKILIKEFRAAIGRTKKINTYSIDFTERYILKSSTKIICLVLIMLLSVVLVFVPHQPIINTNKQQIGVDTHYYVDWVGALIHSSNPQEFLYQAFVEQNRGDRPITLIFIFALSKIVPTNLVNTIEYVPLILGPALIFITYLLTRELTSNEVTSLFAAFLTSVSFQMLIGIYAGFYANWFALIIGYLSFVFLVKFLKKSSMLILSIYSVSIILLLFAHVYTWSVILIASAVFLLIMLRLKYYSKKNIILLLLVLFASVIVDLAKLAIIGSSSGVMQDITVAHGGGIGLEQFALRWSNLIEIVQNWYGTLFANFIILILGLYWMWLSNFRSQVNIFIVIFLSIGLGAAFLGTPTVQGRILYDIPFQIPAALSLSYIKKLDGGTLAILSICILLVGVMFRAVLNFNY